MITLFISDLHLSDQNQDTLEQFEHFIATQASKADVLYILGDLFEVWVGDDDPSQAALRVAQALSSLATLGRKVYYLHGNRDFLLGEQYAQACGMTILHDPTVIECEGKKILVTHGDLLCTDDKAYQIMRTIVHLSWVQRLFLMLPRSVREKIGNKLRSTSSKSHQHKTRDYMDANADTVNAWFKKYDCNIMVHGHTHKPFHHQAQAQHRYVLGAWDIEPVILMINNQESLLFKK